MSRSWSPAARAVGYVTLACAISWSWWIPMIIEGQASAPGRGWPSHLPGLLGPALAAVVVTGASRGVPGLIELGRRCLRWRTGWLPWLAVLAVLGLCVLPLIGDPAARGELLVYSGAPAVGLLVLPYVLVVNGFGEELGWRGFLADELLTIRSRGTAAVLVWLAWAGWHLPLFWIVTSFRAFGVGAVIGWLVGLLCGSVLLTWLYERSGRSVLLVAAWHTAFNFATATSVTTGLWAAIATTVVIAVAVVIGCLPSTWRNRTDICSSRVAGRVALSRAIGSRERPQMRQ